MLHTLCSGVSLPTPQSYTKSLSVCWGVKTKTTGFGGSPERIRVAAGRVELRV